MKANMADHGCHLQMDIQKDGKIIKSYLYEKGKAFEIF